MRDEKKHGSRGEDGLSRRSLKNTWCMCTRHFPYTIRLRRDVWRHTYGSSTVQYIRYLRVPCKTILKLMHIEMKSSKIPATKTLVLEVRADRSSFDTKTHSYLKRPSQQTWWWRGFKTKTIGWPSMTDKPFSTDSIAINNSLGVYPERIFEGGCGQFLQLIRHMKHFFDFKNRNVWRRQLLLIKPMLRAVPGSFYIRRESHLANLQRQGANASSRHSTGGGMLMFFLQKHIFESLAWLCGP